MELPKNLKLKGVEELTYWVSNLYFIMEANKGVVLQNRESWLTDSEQIVQKIAMNSLTCLYLCEGTKPRIKSITAEINFIDFLSIHVIVRSILESFLVLNYVFTDNTVGTRIKKLRYKIWHASSLSQRQKQMSSTKMMKKVLKKEGSILHVMCKEISNSKTQKKYISFPGIKKMKDEKPFDWKPKGGWRGVAKNGPFSDSYWVDIYNMLSSTSHTNAVVTNQLHSDNPKEVQIIQTNTAIGVLNLTIPLFIDAYGTLFPELKKLVYSNKDLFLNINVAKGVVGNYKP